jgi:6-pyruvoyltetrahydropterin/6-carboxytetrahydropterin synthase
VQGIPEGGSLITTATRFHDFCYGHRVFGHENKCAGFHGHNGRVHFTVSAKLDRIGRVLDFSAINDLLCQWVEINWDHKFLVWADDLQASALHALDPSSVRLVPFNPTAELLARYLLTEIGPKQLAGSGVVLTEVTLEETRKCSATTRLPYE